MPEGRDVEGEDLANRSSPKSAFSSATVFSTALPAATCSRFPRAAISIIFFERSIAVIRPLVNRSQTSDTATPCPQPTSRTRLAGSSSRVSTAHTNRSEGLLAMPYALPFPNKGRTSAVSYSATDTESIAARRLVLGPLLRKVSTAACDWMDSDMQCGPVDELLDVAVERPALDQLEVEVGRTLEDRVQSSLTGDHREERHLDAVDQTGGHQRPVHRQAAVRAQRHLGLLL